MKNCKINVKLIDDTINSKVIKNIFYIKVDFMDIHVNGKLFSIEENTNITDLLKTYGIKDSTHTAIEYNDSIIKKDLWGSTILKNNDVIEIVSFVGGG